MRISPVKIIQRTLGAAVVSAAAFGMSASFAQNSIKNKQAGDSFTRIETVSPSGTQNSYILSDAPNPKITVAGKKETAAIVVDLSSNILYQYDEKGNAVNAFLVASGKKSSPTSKGLRIVTHIETYPYKSALASTKRRKNPRDYGPNIICLETVDAKTGIKGVTGEFIHGNNNPNSLGKYASKGCIRMDNEVIKKLAKQIKRGHYVLIK